MFSGVPACVRHCLSFDLLCRKLTSAKRSNMFALLSEDGKRLEITGPKLEESLDNFRVSVPQRACPIWTIWRAHSLPRSQMTSTYRL